MGAQTRTRRKALKAALAELVEGCATPADVARKLADAGCRGRRDDCYECPIAIWLLNQLPGDRVTVTVGRAEVDASWQSAETWHNPDELPEYEDELEATLPPLLITFAEAFDLHSKFPDLEMGVVPQAL